MLLCQTLPHPPFLPVTSFCRAFRFSLMSAVQCLRQTVTHAAALLVAWEVLGGGSWFQAVRFSVGLAPSVVTRV